MESFKKIKISSTLLLLKVILCITTLFFIKKLIDSNRSDIETDFRTLLEYKLALFALAIGLVYFFTIPIIYHDDKNLYIRKVGKREISIPLKNITSIFDNPLTVKNGISTFSIDFLNSSNEINSIKFNAAYLSKRIANFISLVKKENPKVEIV